VTSEQSLLYVLDPYSR